MHTKDSRVDDAGRAADWLCLQLGSREHYAIPRVLAKQERLAGLLTDTWIPRWVAPAVRRFHPSLGQRRHDGISDQHVRAATCGRLVQDVRYRLRRLDPWDSILARNDWFQAWTVRQLATWRQAADASVCFSYSYTARLPFREAKRRGMQCVLGQIDPGPLESVVVAESTADYAGWALPGAAEPPARYWDAWREEVELADLILVNSSWSADLLARAGVSLNKIAEVPLAHEGGQRAARPRRCLPATGRASADSTRRTTSGEEERRPRMDGRDMVVLFLGQVILRKGVGQLFEAVRLLEGHPIRFVFAGPLGVQVPAWIRSNPQVEFTGPVDREEAARLYRSSDVFVLPTLSDGFALTQLEAQAHGLPVIASSSCGRVVNDGVNGLILAEVTPQAIAEALRRLAQEPELLERLQRNSRMDEAFSLNALGHKLSKIESRLKR
ncbi:glycosyltransferase family 4 protein [Synoicihabitans lomoniglobus]|uniref:Glycosyltransferase family 4 protein n=1 Tax=Synoicihabitans lomoniglobus TaxID=2909285 RepID=A0AAF0I3U0_9BACT|nr:glycosyltransferase family 4 protein [Opitutaceae bacterium LMO-M01]WED66359.1 glycosyltransferase family 4 protein [Opitutaceae bacterium LMO-M01]